MVRLKVVQECFAVDFQPSLAGLCRPLKFNPGLASWAKFNRPSGTECGNEVLTNALKPLRFWEKLCVFY
jgi:hypothetical protein